MSTETQNLEAPGVTEHHCSTRILREISADTDP